MASTPTTPVKLHRYVFNTDRNLGFCIKDQYFVCIRFPQNIRY